MQAELAFQHLRNGNQQGYRGGSGNITHKLQGWDLFIIYHLNLHIFYLSITYPQQFIKIKDIFTIKASPVD